MSRGVWFLAGAGAGVYAMVRGRRAAEALTADGLADRLGALALGARMLRTEVAQGKADKEAALRERYGLDAHGHPALTAARQPERAPQAAPEQAPPQTPHRTPHRKGSP